MATSSRPTPANPEGVAYYVPALVPSGPAAAREPEDQGFQIQTLLRILQRRRRPFLLTLVAVTLASSLYTLRQRIYNPVFLGGFTLLISDPVNNPGNNPGSREDSGLIAEVARNRSNTDVPTLIRVLESSVVLEPVFTQLAKEQPGVALPSIDVSLVAADPSQKNAILASGILAVQARGSSPDLVREALQLTEKAYLSWSLQQRREQLAEGVKFLDQQAPELQARAARLQGEVEAFRLAHRVLQPGQEAEGIRSQAETLRSKLRNQQAEQQRLRDVRAEVARGNLSARGYATSASDTSGQEGSATGTNVQLAVPNQAQLDELARLEQEIATAQATYTPGSSYLQNLIASRDKLRPQVQSKELEAIDTALKQYETSIASTQRQIRQLDSLFEVQPRLLRQYEELQRKLELANDNLSSYLKTRDQFQLQIAQNTIPWKVISPTSVDARPVEPRLMQGLLRGLMLGLVAGVGVAILRDRLDHVFHSPGEVRDDLRQPLLGHIPYISFFEGVRQDRRFLLAELDTQGSGVAGYQRFYYQEAFRNLYTSLRFLSTEKPLRSVAMTSSVPSEGKSLAIVLLAKTLSEMGQKVLLVDADLRKPQIHHRLGLNNLEGLSNLLTEEEGRGWKDVIQHVPDYPNWDVLTAGRRPPDPPRLLGSQRMAELVQEIAETGSYDLILYDTPPALGLADAALTAEKLDGILLLVSLNRVDRSLPVEVINRMNSAKAPLLGIVTNARSKSENQSSLYGYGSGKYGYGYGGYGEYGPREAALDPSTAYSYYRSDDGGDGNGKGSATRPRTALEKITPSGQNMRRWGRRLKRWIDG